MKYHFTNIQIMKSNLAIFVIFFGFLILALHMYYDYASYGRLMVTDFWSEGDPFNIFFHIVTTSTFIGSLITAYIINDRKKLLEQSKLNERRLEQAAYEWSATFDAMPYGILLTDGECTIIRANQYIANLSNLPQDELPFKRKCYNTVCNDGSSSNICPIKENTPQKNLSHEFFNTDHNKFFSESITPMLNFRGEAMSYVHVLVDITELKLKEKKIIESKDAFLNMLKDTDAAYQEMRNIYDSLIAAFSNIIDAKSSWTRGHSVDVSRYAMRIAKELGLEELEIETLRIAALLHDIGKIGAYDIILNKPGRLTEEEFVLIRRHPVQGEDILKPIKGLEKILPIVRSHHERIDPTSAV